MRVIFTYDTEKVGECVPKLATIHAVHKRFNAPLTIFVTGNVIEEDGKELRKLIDISPELWDVNSHSYSHQRLIFKPPWSKQQPTPEMVRHEVSEGARLVREQLGRPCRGLRPRSGAGAGFRGCPDALMALRDSGFTWTSAYLKSTFADSLPNDLYGAYTYEPDGFPDIIEIPSHGWQDACVKPEIIRMGECVVRWPAPYKNAFPDRLVETPEEEFAVHLATFEGTMETDLQFTCFCMHPWTMIRPQDPGGRVIEMLLEYIEEHGHGVTTLDAEVQRCREYPELLWTAPEIPPQRIEKIDVGAYFA